MLKERYYNYIKQGLCGNCGIRPLVNRTRCSTCRDKAKERYKSRVTKRICVLCKKTSSRVGRTTCVSCSQSLADKRAAAKDVVFNHYGNKCCCCGEMIKQFLTLDHINDDGADHRRRLKSFKSGNNFIKWVIRNNFPADLQLLCWNCNCGRALNGGVCPHQRETT